MKKKRVLIISSLIVLGLIGIYSIVSVFASPSLGSGAPTVVSYQGVVKDSGTPYDGIGYFKFAVVNAAGDNSYWSNDGTSTVGDEPTAGVSLTVNEGLFQVLLGDTGLTNMISLPASVFSGTGRYLRVWFSDDDVTYAALSPDQQFAAVPYALQAQEASVADSLSIMGAGSGLDADLLDGQEGVAYQDRVSGICAPGSTIRSVNSDGSVICQDDAPFNRTAPPENNTVTTLDSTGNVGSYSSITIGIDGLPIIGYRNVGHDGDLKFAHCNDAFCTSGSISTIDSTGDVGYSPSITVGTDGLSVISYYDYTTFNLKVAHCSNTACTSASLTTLDNTGECASSSTAIGVDGLPIISYCDDIGSGDLDLKVAHCDDAACASATLTTIDSTGNVGWHNSIAIGTDGLPVISYSDATNDDLKVAHCSDIVCTSAGITTLDSAGYVGYDTSITIGVDGLPVISYYDDGNFDLKVAHCNNNACTSASLTTLDSSGDVGASTSITIGADGLPVISYSDRTNLDLKVAHCFDAACTGASFISLDTTEDVGWNTSITIGSDRLPIISYTDDGNDDLKVIHCSNPFCVPYFRRR